MKYSIGDRVVLNDNSRSTLPVGTRGTIIKVYKLSISYDVKFKEVTRRILERSLDPA